MCRAVRWIFQSRLLFVCTLVLIFYGLFLVPNNDQAGRVWNEVWNLGHVAAFLICWTFVFNLFPRVRQLSFLKLAVLVIASTLVIAELIEIVQGWIGRDNEWQDVWDSSVGALLALAFCPVQLHALSLRSRLLWRGLALLALVAIPWTIWSNLADALIMNRQFPVLSNFTTPFEITRWRGERADLELKKPARRQAYLSVKFQPGQYSTLILKHFKRDWQGYHKLVMLLRNPESKPYPIILRIHDRQHKLHHFALSDRFNRKIILKPGQQRIVISLSAVRDAPRTRKMDMQHLAALELFTMGAQVYHQLDVEKMYLE